MNKLYYTPGPSALYYTAEEHLKRALKEQIPSISHRGAQFQEIYKLASDRLRSLLALPDNYQILFTASATEIWERSIQNCVAEQSVHLINGAFSQRFYEISKQLGKGAVAFEVPHGSSVDPAVVKVADPELIAVTHNETSTGVSQPLADITALRAQYPDTLITVDGVSSLPAVALDYSQIDAAYLSVQKCFGLPAGLGVWLVNERMLAKAEALAATGQSIGSYHSLPALISRAAKNQTPETPNVLGIYLLAAVAGDMLDKGIDMIRRETAYKAALLYHAFDTHPALSVFAKKESLRSQTVLVAEVEGGSAPLIEYLAAKGLVAGIGYGQYKASQLRIANFPTHSKEQFEYLTDLITSYKV